jgi:geranylgeranyl reductase family protein
MYDVIIIGAGPAGCRTAEIISSKGYSTLVIEEHTTIGRPTQCTGLVSNKIGKIPKKIILNKIKNARFYSGKSYFEVESKENAYVIDRAGFDRFTATKARSSGVEFKLGVIFSGLKGNTIYAGGHEYKTKILVGADGPNSFVAKANSIKLPKNFILGMQARVKGNFDPVTVELHFGSDVAPGFFTWIVPEDEHIARIGLMANKNIMRYFEKFVKMAVGNARMHDKFGDLVRYGLIEKSCSDNTILVGDAACQIKPFSAGGLVYGQVGAKYAGDSCIKALEQSDFSEEFLLENYDKKWKGELAGPIKTGLFFKKIFSVISDEPLIFDFVRNLKISNLSGLLNMDFLGKN